MHIVHVYVHVKPECVEEFIRASNTNACQSIQEPGIARFDVIQQTDNPARFLLLEVYRSPEDVAKHKQTEHYAAWAETVEDMLAEPRSKTIYQNCFPDDDGWG